MWSDAQRPKAHRQRCWLSKYSENGRSETRFTVKNQTATCQRRLRIVEGRLQGQLLRQVCWHWSLFLLIAATLTIGLGLLTSDPQTSLSNQLWQIGTTHMLPFLVLLTLLPYFLVDTVRLSNRFAGPVRRLRTGLEDLAQREQVQPMVFRDGDFWVSTAVAYNAVAEQQQAMKNKIKQLEAELERVREQSTARDLELTHHADPVLM